MTYVRGFQRLFLLSLDVDELIFGNVWQQAMNFLQQWETEGRARVRL